MESPAAVQSKSSNQPELAPTVSFIEKFFLQEESVATAQDWGVELQLEN